MDVRSLVSGSRKKIALGVAVATLIGGVGVERTFAAPAPDPDGYFNPASGKDGYHYKVGSTPANASIYRDAGSTGTTAKVGGVGAIMKSTNSTYVFCRTSDNAWFWTQGDARTNGSNTSWGWLKYENVINKTAAKKIATCKFPATVQNVTVQPLSATPSNSGQWALPLPNKSFSVMTKMTYSSGATHNAVDLARPNNASEPAINNKPFYAAHAGTVSYAGGNCGLGIVVTFTENGKSIRHEYCHASKRVVNSGSSVAVGQQLGLVGSTGNSSGAHLHFAVRENGSVKNPITYMKERGVDICAAAVRRSQAQNC